MVVQLVVAMASEMLPLLKDILLGMLLPHKRSRNLLVVAMENVSNLAKVTAVPVEKAVMDQLKLATVEIAQSEAATVNPSATITLSRSLRISKEISPLHRSLRETSQLHRISRETSKLLRKARPQ